MDKTPFEEWWELSFRSLLPHLTGEENSLRIKAWAKHGWEACEQYWLKERADTTLKQLAVAVLQGEDIAPIFFDAIQETDLLQGEEAGLSLLASMTVDDRLRFFRQIEKRWCHKCGFTLSTTNLKCCC